MQLQLYGKKIWVYRGVIVAFPHFSRHVNLINYESIKEGEIHEKKS